MMFKRSFPEIDEKFDKILDELKDLRKELDESSKSHHDHHRSHSEKADSIIDSIKAIEKEQLGYMTQLKEEIAEAKKTNDEFKRRLDTFKILQDKASKKLLDETNTEIISHIDSMMHSTKRYKLLEAEMEKLNTSIEGIRQDIEKFKTISSSIRKEDFNLKKFYDKVTSEDREKLRLMNENDRLKRMIAKERRGRR